MCGIAGIITPNMRLATAERLRSMMDSLTHRGPDDEGLWSSDNRLVHFAQRRLSILELSDSAAQPLQYLHYLVIFNGEIYNYKELKAELAAFGYRFYTDGDTEVIPAAYDHWGNEMLHHFDGMFAFALYDTITGTLLLARDRFGEKPLYYFASYTQRGDLEQLVFGSEMKALWAAGVPKILNHTMMLNYLGTGLVQNPIIKTDTFYRDILSLPPGCLLQVQTQSMHFVLQRWYKPHERIGHLREAGAGQEGEIIETFRQLLLQSVQRRLRSDMPVGTSLSGGLDSSSVVACIDTLTRQKAPLDGWANVCFSAIFPGFEKDEARWSKQVASHFKVSQYTVSPTADDLLEHFDRMMYHQEEPVQSSSAFTQFMVYKLAKEEAVSVLLDGQGADEILAGYPRYSHWYLQQLLRASPKSMLYEKKRLLQHGMLPQWGLGNYLAAYLPGRTAKYLRQKALRQQNESPLQRDYLQAHQDVNTLFKPEIRNLDDILFFSTFNLGLEELLRYADRNSMAHSREVRLPFLNVDLVEYIFSLPARYKIRDGFGKWILRKSMEPLLPPGIAWRTDKVGYEPPQKQWMQQTLMQEAVMESRKVLVREGIIRPSELNRPVMDKGAHEAANYDWRYLCAGWMLGAYPTGKP